MIADANCPLHKVRVKQAENSERLYRMIQSVLLVEYTFDDKQSTG